MSDAELSPSLLRNPELDTWIRIHADGTVTLRTGKVEIGLGIKTAIAMIGAEELDVSIDRIRVRTADTASSPNELYTAGSTSIEESGEAPVPPDCPEIRMTSACALATPAAIVPTPTSATSFTLIRARGLAFLRS